MNIAYGKYNGLQDFNKKYVGSDVATLTNKYMPNQQLEN